MRILVATDAWHPQVNGVVRTYERLAQEAPKLGAEICFLTPADFLTLPCPTYPEIRLSLATPGMIARRVEAPRPDFIHIATEGPIGLMTRQHCRKTKRPFTTSYHTRFPEYVSARLPIPESWCYGFQKRFHNSGAGLFVATASVEDDLRARGFERMMRWSRGVDLELYHPRPLRLFGDGPVFLYVGRIAVEKNIKAFLDLDLPGRKVVVGSGPQLAELRRVYPEVLFTGPKQGEDLAQAYCSADVFVFPSLTDTFGLVLLEALACGVPVAAFPVSGPKDVLTDPACGVLDTDLRAAAMTALGLDRKAARAHALQYSWENSAREFIDNVLTAHHLGLPERRRLLPRWRGRRPAQKKTARLGGNRAVSFMRQFGGRFGGHCVHPEMVSSP
ncbi:glycosyltransferase family 4 protein [Methyloceanibacter superfactus]|uniref:glycosyltransferase family 4 protein n=1 Tax=Methyloceanibacter superfactus TaxID=1774969 RepID=UPI000849D8F1|nr:glycosyltransferase family 1 protein [Methyloceanibacter superfactus]